MRNRRYLQTIQWLISKFSVIWAQIDGHCYHGNAVEQEQVEKLVAIYTARPAIRCTSTL